MNKCFLVNYTYNRDDKQTKQLLGFFYFSLRFFLAYMDQIVPPGLGEVRGDSYVLKMRSAHCL